MGVGGSLKRGEGHDLCSSSLSVNWIISLLASVAVLGLNSHSEQWFDSWLSGLLRVRD